MSDASHEISSREPRDTYELAGQDAAENAFLDAMRRGRLHHAWLLTGPRGVGKATFAYRAARRLLGAKPDPSRGVLGADPDDPVCRRIQARGHGDLLVLTRPYDAKRDRLKGAITVDVARTMPTFFSSTAGEGGWRVCIIDAADDLNVNAANAILKTLEEPPKRAVVFLVAHTPGRLPATVRSRCRRLAFTAPGVDVATDVVGKALGISADDARAAAELSEGRPGEAIRLAAAGGVGLAHRLEAVFDALPRLEPGVAHKLAEEIGAKDAEDLRDLFFESIGAIARRRARQAARDGGDVEPWGKFWDTASRLQREMDGLNLDPKLVVLDALEAARQAAAA